MAFVLCSIRGGQVVGDAEIERSVPVRGEKIDLVAYLAPQGFMHPHLSFRGGAKAKRPGTHEHRRVKRGTVLLILPCGVDGFWFFRFAKPWNLGMTSVGSRLHLIFIMN